MHVNCVPNDLLDNKYLPIINIIAEQFIDQNNKDNFLFTDEIVDRT